MSNSKVYFFKNGEISSGNVFNTNGNTLSIVVNNSENIISKNKRSVFNNKKKNSYDNDITTLYHILSTYNKSNQFDDLIIRLNEQYKSDKNFLNFLLKIVNKEKEKIIVSNKYMNLIQKIVELNVSAKNLKNENLKEKVKSSINLIKKRILRNNSLTSEIKNNLISIINGSF